MAGGSHRRRCGEDRAGDLRKCKQAKHSDKGSSPQGNAEDLAFLSFWMYNANVLLYLLLSEENMAATCDELGVLGIIEELINAIHGQSLHGTGNVAMS